MSPDQRALFEAHTSLAHRMVRRVVAMAPALRPHQDDLLQEALLALFRAARGFDSRRRVLFFTYAHRAISTALRRSGHRMLAVASGYGHEGFNGDRADGDLEAEPDRSDTEREVAAREVAALALRALPERDREMFFCCEFGDADQSAYAEAAGITRQAMHGRMLRARQRFAVAADQLRREPRAEPAPI